MREERGNAPDRAGLALDVEQRKITLGRGVKFQNLRDTEPVLELFHTSGRSPLPQHSLIRCVGLRGCGSAFVRYRQSSPMYWNKVQSHRVTSFQNCAAENFSPMNTEPPLTSTAPVATTPPTL